VKKEWTRPITPSWRSERTIPIGWRIGRPEPLIRPVASSYLAATPEEAWLLADMEIELEEREAEDAQNR
jgi:hypothetical protein